MDETEALRLRLLAVDKQIVDRVGFGVTSRAHQRHRAHVVGLGSQHPCGSSMVTR
jgi:hypothetical protein